jgi:hypothetical protein
VKEGSNMSSKSEKPVKIDTLDRELQRREANDATKKAVPPHRLSQFGKDRKPKR